MDARLLQTKLYRPLPRVDPAPKLGGGFIPRPRLLARLDEGIAGKLTLISAGAGFGKTMLVSAWLERHGWAWDQVDTTFYSDSMNDVPLLERVDHPVATNPDPKLRALAQARGWRILDLFAKTP